MLEVKRTLVKSGPELWAEVSDPEALSGHLAPFGPIRITRTAGDSLVEWEGERVTGRLALEPSGFGTRVVMTLDLGTPEAPPPPAPDTPRPTPPVLAAPMPTQRTAPPAPPPARRGGLFARLFRRGAAAPPPVETPRPEPVAAPVAAAPPEPVAEEPPRMSDDDARAALASVLDHLGTAHHRPFTRT
jgi:hypothetical protein